MNKRILLALSVMVVIGGCASSGDSSTTDSPPKLQGDHPLDGLSLPFEPLLGFASADATLLDEAINQLADACMTERGYDFIPYPPKPERSVLDPSFRYGYLSSDSAALTGYQSTRQPTEDPDYTSAVDAVDLQRQSSGPDYETTLYGTPDDQTAQPGCIALAEKEIYGVAGGLYALEDNQAIIDLQSTSSDVLYSSSEAQEAVSKWSACMGESGYSFTDWWQAREPFGAETGTTDAQRQQAQVDSACRSRIGLETTLFDLETSIMSKTIDDNQGLIDRYTGELDAAVARAKETLN